MCGFMLFFYPYFMQLLLGAILEVSKLKWKKRTSFHPQQWNIASVQRPLLAEGARRPPGIHRLHFNIVLPSLSKYYTRY